MASVVAAVGALPWVLFGLGMEHDVWWEVYRPLCHQRSERSLSSGAVTMVVCSRCAGLYAGMVLGSLLASADLSSRLLRYATLGSAAGMICEVVTQELGLHGVYHPTRLASGLLLSTSGVAWTLGLLRREADARLRQ